MLDLLGAGAIGLGGIFDYLGGGDQRKYEQWMRQHQQQMSGQLQGELNNPAISQGQINQFIPLLQKSLAPQINSLAGRLSNRVGLDSGAAQGEIGRQSAGSLYQMLGGFQQQAAMANAEKRQNILRMLAGLGG